MRRKKGMEREDKMEERVKKKGNMKDLWTEGSRESVGRNKL